MTKHLSPSSFQSRAYVENPLFWLETSGFTVEKPVDTVDKVAFSVL